jgi:sodium-dependent dicarboxylate transporter 2/3/5
MLAVAYASNVGGIGTKIGSGTNSIFAGFAWERLHQDIGFLTYMAVALPFVVLFLPIVWLLLWQVARADGMASTTGRAVLERETLALGMPSRAERKVAAVFALAALLWAFSDLIRPLLAKAVARTFEFSMQGKHYEAAVALLAAALLAGFRLLSWSSLRKLPFASLVLLGGSLAMAHGIEQSGLSTWIGERLSLLGSLSLAAQLGLASFGTILLSAFASNTATVNVVLNVLPKDISVLFAAAMAASCDFMLPAGTPPNAIVFGSGYVRLSTMIRVGFVLDMLAALLLTVYMLLYGRHLL